MRIVAADSFCRSFLEVQVMDCIFAKFVLNEQEGRPCIATGTFLAEFVTGFIKAKGIK
jgi:hypothetical protein